MLPGVHAMTDVTGFGLFGHLLEMCRASAVAARVDFPAVPQLADLASYVAAGMTPGGTRRNWDSYGHHVGPLDDITRAILCDPQTSGGLLVAVDPLAAPVVAEVLAECGLGAHLQPVGELLPGPVGTVEVGG
jgi:selenide,water dikinase